MSIFKSGFQASSLSGRVGVSSLAVAAALACGQAAAAGAAPSADTEDFAKGRILVMTRAGLADGAFARIVAEQGGGQARRIGKGNLRVVKLRAGMTERQLVERLARHPHVKFAELDRRVPLAAVANDPYLGSQWHLPKINAPTAWDSTQGAGVKIAIIDTGVDGTHPDLAARMLPGWNFYDGNSNAADVNGHGTAVAGAAAATVNNGAGVASVAGQASIIPIRISAPDGFAYWSTIAEGLFWAADNGARVANISYAVTGSWSVLDAATYMRSKGGLVVVSAGNNGISETTPPSNEVITVSATGSTDARPSWSSYGPFVTISAPGEGIWTTTRGGGYGAWNGTSFASPVTAGVVGLMMAANSTLPIADVERLLYSTSVDLGTAGRDPQFGWGRVNAAAAVQAAVAAAQPPADTQSPTVSVTAPLGSSTVSGLVPVDVSASDNKGVVRVDLKVNGTVVASDGSAPYSFSWDSKGVANGMASIVAVAVDAAGNTGTSASVAVNVANVVPDTTAPTVTISNPLNGAKVAGSIMVRISAADNLGTAGITQTLSIDGKQVATAAGGTLNYAWNTRRLAIGSHTIQAVARDAAGNASTQTITVTR